MGSSPNARGAIGPNRTGIPRQGQCVPTGEFFLTWNKQDGKSASGAWRSKLAKSSAQRKASQLSAIC